MAILARHDASQRVEQICQEQQISPATFNKWKKAPEISQNEDRSRLKYILLFYYVFALDIKFSHLRLQGGGMNG